MAGETILGTAVVPIRATLDQLERDLSGARAKSEAGAKAAGDAAGRAFEKGMGKGLSNAIQQIGAVGSSIASKLGAPLEALGRAPIKAVTIAVQGLGSALAIPSRAAGLLASTLGRISAGPIGLLKASVGGLGAAFTAPIRAVGGLTKALGAIGLATLGIRAVIGAAKGLGDALGVNLASDVNESWNKVTVLFGKAAGVVDAFANTAADAFGMSKLAALDAAGQYGNLFRTIGLGQEPAAKLSVSLLKVAADLGSFNNVGTEDVLEKIRAGLIGESEPLRSLGININETAVEAKGFAMGLGHMEKSGKKWIRVLSDSDKLQARAALIMEQSSVAANDFANTSSGMANAQKRIAAGFSNISLAIGNKLLPVIAPLIADFAANLPKALDKVMPLIEGFGRSAADIGKLIKGEITLGQYGEKVKAAIQTALDQAWAGVKSTAFDLWDKLTGGTTWTVGADGKTVTATRMSIEEGLKTIWGKVVVKGVELWDKLKLAATPAAEKVIAWAKGIDLSAIWGKVADFGGNIWDKLTLRTEQTDASGKMNTYRLTIAGEITKSLASIWDLVQPAAVDIGKFLFGKNVMVIGASGEHVPEWQEGFISATLRQIDTAMGDLAKQIETDPTLKAQMAAAGLALGNTIRVAFESWASPGKDGAKGGLESLGEAFGTSIAGPFAENVARGILNAPPNQSVGEAFDKYIKDSIAYVLLQLANPSQGKALQPTSWIETMIANQLVGPARSEELKRKILEEYGWTGNAIPAAVAGGITNNTVDVPTAIAAQMAAAQQAGIIPALGAGSDTGNWWAVGAEAGIGAGGPAIVVPAVDSAIELMNDPASAFNGGNLTGYGFDIGVVAGLTSKSAVVSNTASAVLTGAQNAAFVTATSGGKNIGWAMDNGMIAGLVSGQTRVNAMARSVALGAYNAAKTALQSASPSKVFAKLGESMMLGMEQGINQTGARPIAATVGVTRATFGGQPSLSQSSFAAPRLATSSPTTANWLLDGANREPAARGGGSRSVTFYVTVTKAADEDRLVRKMQRLMFDDRDTVLSAGVAS